MKGACTMKPINVSKCVSTQIFGIHIPMGSVYGTHKLTERTTVYFYVDDIVQFRNKLGHKPTTCYYRVHTMNTEQGYFRESTIRGDSPLARRIVKFLRENYLFDSEIVYHNKALNLGAPKQKKAQTEYTFKGNPTSYALSGRIETAHCVVGAHEEVYWNKMEKQPKKQPKQQPKQQAEQALYSM